MKARLHSLWIFLRKHAVLSAVCLLASATALAENHPPKEPLTHTVNKGSLKIKVELEGFFESADMAPVKISPKSWTDWVVLEAVPHGTAVRKGETLIRVDTEKLEEQIADLEAGRPEAKIALELARTELENLEQSQPVKLQSARRTQRIAEEDYDYFQSVSRAQKIKTAQFSLQSAEQRLANAQEELNQLEKMYAADDLTEETEEIILKRQRFQVEAALFSLENAKLHAERELNINLPREHEQLTLAKREQELALTLAEESLPRKLAQKKLELEKQQRDHQKNRKKLQHLKHDLEAAKIAAPTDGIVYYGHCEHGKWQNAAAIAKKLVPGGKLTPHEVFMTIVDPNALIVSTILPEAELQHVRRGLEGEASPAIAPDRKLPVTVKEVGFVPLPAGGYEARLTIEPGNDLRLVPGMSCKLTFAGISKENVLVVPKSAVFTEEKESVVYLAKQEDAERRTVKTGRSDDDMIEILEGLSEGDVILLNQPE